MKKNHFTMTELLVVVAVIIILFGIGVPAVIKGMRQGELTECKGNLKQLSTAVSVYLKDNKNYFPSETGDQWVATSGNPISTYLGNSFDNVNVCPSNPSDDESYRASAYDDGSGDFDFDLNATGGTKGLKLSKVKRPNTMSLFVSKEVYNQSSISDQWHGTDNTFPFVNVGGSITSFVFSSSDLTNANKSTRYDFKND
ncbi:type II secretion system protein [Lentisphaera profundi]|uniref:Type II secretion system protein n=1 Tax=Lentisphaera profundi TaxID=1658616 RepID=A0ABY7VS96_9BACT|nr:type II secretion system protein [Lentisphaera profundi]WDE96592.1 type II secretion system protein [Lentisphaera profundi]